jgi:hypothetical protein
VQVQRCVDLRPEHPVDALRGEGGDHSVVEDTGSMHDRGDPVLGEQRGQCLVVGDIARGHGDRGAGNVDLAAAAAHQQQVADAVCGDEVRREPAPQLSGAAGDQYRAVGIPRRASAGAFACEPRSHQPGHSGNAMPQCDLGFT